MRGVRRALTWGFKSTYLARLRPLLTSVTGLLRQQLSAFVDLGCPRGRLSILTWCLEYKLEDSDSRCRHLLAMRRAAVKP